MGLQTLLQNYCWPQSPEAALRARLRRFVSAVAAMLKQMWAATRIPMLLRLSEVPRARASLLLVSKCRALVTSRRCWAHSLCLLS